MKSKLLAFLLSLALCISLVPAAAAATDVIDAKDDLATVTIAQTCNGNTSDSYTHNYATDGDEVGITYTATLYMTDEMAMYLQPRQAQLMDAKFNVHVEMDMEKLEFIEKGQTLTITFSSAFLKPWDVDESDQREYPGAFHDYTDGNYESKFLGRSDEGIFSYTISVDKDWAQKYAEEHGCIDIPMELIVYFDGTTAYGYEDIPASAANEKAMFYNFTVKDWMKEIQATMADVRVKDSVRESVTDDPTTWKTVENENAIEAQGTIDGEFTYEKSHKITNIGDYQSAENPETLEFGNDFATDNNQIIEEWTSNVVTVELIRQLPDQPDQPGQPDQPDVPDQPDQPDQPTEPDKPDGPDSPYLNLEDHFAYIIGYPVDYITGEPTDDMSRWPVKPEGTITRAEVATIFFRMLTDETRNQYWSQTNPYSDVDINDWYNNAISTLNNLGIIEGYPDGTFQPNGNITRAEFATIAVRFFVITEDYTWNEDAFSDIAGHWANEYINLAYLLELINGYPDGTFRPQNAITRAEAMTIVNNTLRRNPCKEGLLPVEDMIMWPDNMDATLWYYEEVQEATNSHEYTYETGLDGEQWTAELPVRDWAAFEKAWSDANSAANPGEVVDGH